MRNPRSCTRQRRGYGEVLYDGTPDIPVVTSKDFYAFLRKELAKSGAGAARVRLREQTTTHGRSITGLCGKGRCSGCTWKMLATLTLKQNGSTNVLISCDGKHGEQEQPRGTALWTHAEAAAIERAFPGGALLSAKGIRKALEEAKMGLKCTSLQIKQFVSRENKKRRSESGDAGTSVQGLKNVVSSWIDKQSASWVDAALTELRVLQAADCAAGHCFFAWSCRGFLNNLKGIKNRLVCLVVDGKQKIATTGAVIASVGVLCSSETPRNTTLARDTEGKKLQAELRTNTVQLVMQAYMDAESTDNFVRFFQLLCDTAQAEFGVSLPSQVLQMHSDFSDSIEAARRKVFPKARPCRDYPHMMRAVQGTLSKKALEDWRARTLHALRCTRFLPTAELFSAVWKLILPELQAAGKGEVVAYLKKEYIKDVRKEVLEKKFSLRDGLLAETTLLWADYWSGVLGTHPGSATGTQTIEAFHSFWQEQIRRKARSKPGEVLLRMQGLYQKEWKAHMVADSATHRASLWPTEPDPLFVSGTGLHRLGQNSAEEYWAARQKRNVQKVEDKSTNTTFYVLRAQKTDKEEPAQANVSEAIAQRIVRLILLAGPDLDAALSESGVVRQVDTGAWKLDLASLDLLFNCHCVVMIGDLPRKYYARLYNHADVKDKAACTCPTFGQRAQCSHVYYIEALTGQIDLRALPQKQKRGRPKKRPAEADTEPQAKQRCKKQ